MRLRSLQPKKKNWNISYNFQSFVIFYDGYFLTALKTMFNNIPGTGKGNNLCSRVQ